MPDEPASSPPNARKVLTLVVSAAGILIVGWAIYTLINPPARPVTRAEDVEQVGREAPTPASTVEPSAATDPARHLGTPPSAPEPKPPNPTPEAPEPAGEDTLPPPVQPDALEQRSIQAYLKNRPQQISPARLEARADRALARLDELPDPPLQPGGDEFADLTGIWDEFTRVRSTAAYLASDDGDALGVDTRAYADALEHLDAKYVQAQKKWSDRQADAMDDDGE